jgi:hypothetical protein
MKFLIYFCGMNESGSETLPWRLLIILLFAIEVGSENVLASLNDLLPCDLCFGSA